MRRRLEREKTASEKKICAEFTQVDCCGRWINKNGTNGGERETNLWVGGWFHLRNWKWRRRRQIPCCLVSCCVLYSSSFSLFLSPELFFFFFFSQLFLLDVGIVVNRKARRRRRRLLRTTTFFRPPQLRPWPWSEGAFSSFFFFFSSSYSQNQTVWK